MRSSALSSPWSCASQRRIATRPDVGLDEQSSRSRAPWPSSARSPRACRAIRWRPTSSSKRAQAHRRHVLAHLLGDEEEVVDDVLGRALEALAQHRVLRGDADGAGVQVALAHHDAARGDQRRGGEAASRRRRAAPRSTTSRPVRMPPSACTAMRPRRRLATSVCCVSASPISHGDAGMLDRGQRRGAGAALVAARW